MQYSETTELAIHHVGGTIGKLDSKRLRLHLKVTC